MALNQIGSTARKASFPLPGRPNRAALHAARFNPSFNAARFVSTRLPEYARLLMVRETSPFYYERAMVAPSAFDVHPLQGIALPGSDLREILRELSALGFTHVLVNWPEWRRLGDAYYRTLWPKKIELPLSDFLRGCPLYTSTAWSRSTTLEGRSIEHPLCSESCLRRKEHARRDPAAG